jgi:uncharacterized protein (DUF2249 family)
MPNVVIDAREMHPPEPLERALTALDLIRDNGELTLILNQRPQLLFRFLQNNGYKWSEADTADGGFSYKIFKG